MKVLVLVCHPNLEDSQSQQFLLQTGQSMAETVDYYDLASHYKETGAFQTSVELERLGQYDRIIFQFNLYWYQAPYILKVWLDQVFDEKLDQSLAFRILSGKDLGLVVITGSKASKYQVASGHGVTLDEVLSPYRAFAKYWQMNFLPYFSIHQLSSKSPVEEWTIMLEYITYLETGQVDSFTTLQNTVIERLRDLIERSVPISIEDQTLRQLFLESIQSQANQLDDLYSIDGEDY